MYASTTQVPVEKSRAEIEGLLCKHKASQYLTAIDNETHRAVVQFKMQNRIIKFDVTLPKPPQYASRPNLNKHEQAMRQRWRALLLVLKAKLEAIENHISSFESEFLAHIVIPGGDVTVGEYLAPRLAAVYEHGGPLLAEHAGPSRP